MAQFLWYDCTFKKQCTVPVTLTFQWIEYNPISILYKFQIDIFSNSREIKHQNIGQTHERQTNIHEIVGSSPTRRSNFSNLNLYNSPCVPPPPLPSHKNTHSLCVGRGD